MNLVQKLPIGLSLACMLMLSSCSKEDVATPTPQVGEVNESSGLRGSWSADPNVPPGGLNTVPAEFPSTIGAVGCNIYPQYWERKAIISHDNPGTTQSGTSSLIYLFDAAVPYDKPLSPVIGAINSESIVTVGTKSNVGNSGDRAIVRTKLKKLIPSKKYEVTFHVATTRNKSANNFQFPYAKAVYVTTRQSSGSQNHLYSLEGKQAEWLTKKLEFTASDTEADFEFSAISEQKGELSWGHIFVDSNAIKQLN